MNRAKTFYAHESDSDIMVKKNQSEVATWTDDLSYVDKEVEYLLEIEDRILQSSELYQQLLAIRRENTLRLGLLHQYGNTLEKSIECDTLACDIHYINHHEKTRNAFLHHLKNYRTIKTALLTKVLSKVHKSQA